MCYSVAYLEKKARKLAERYKDFSPARLPEPGDLPTFYFVSGFSHPLLPVMRHDGLHLCRWGLVPHWAKDVAFADGIRSKTLNARGETVFEKPSFRGSITSKRCLLPVSGFFEWRTVNKVKYPYYIRVREEHLFSLGCIFDTWTDRQTGEHRQTFSIVTTAANPLMETIHNLKKRMPLIIGREDEAAWADPELVTHDIRKLVKPFDETRMEAWPVSRSLNNPRNQRDIPEALEEVVYEELET